MYKEVLRSIDNIEIWPIISFVIFFSFFIGLLWWTFSADKKFIDEMKRKPLQDESLSSNSLNPQP
ncbi:MAG: cbb3-type cytochrome c oxidase subunit 3 [Chryseotalea sp. WA131a]|jgi:cytochrome c oxidase cbb3-type subunit 4|nr:MAG: cbb3-type cytochrome c oxidase subunit 3 [Chryseotalea sp. WA131a]